MHNCAFSSANSTRDAGGLVQHAATSFPCTFTPLPLDPLPTTGDSRTRYFPQHASAVAWAQGRVRKKKKNNHRCSHIKLAWEVLYLSPSPDHPLLETVNRAFVLTPASFISSWSLQGHKNLIWSQKQFGIVKSKCILCELILLWREE